MSGNDAEDGFKVQYHKYALKFEVLRRVVSQVSESHMQDFYILFNNSKEAYDNMELKDEINKQYKIIQEAEPSFTTMEFIDIDQDEYMLPSGCDWKNLFHDMHDEYLQYAGNGGRFLKSLQLFLTRTDDPCGDIKRLIRSLNLITFMIEDEFEESEDED
jgi:hypothetical protein